MEGGQRANDVPARALNLDLMGRLSDALVMTARMRAVMEPLLITEAMISRRGDRTPPLLSRRDDRLDLSLCNPSLFSYERNCSRIERSLSIYDRGKESAGINC